VTTRLVLVGFVLSGLGCVLQAPAPSVPGVRAVTRTIGYLCSDQSGFRVSIAADGASATLEGLASGPVTLPIAPSASGARYTDGTTTRPLRVRA
jgi:membrane-bound inhibitor of C-type lysozyme